MNPNYRAMLPTLEAFLVAEPFFAIDESWAEEPSAESWEADAIAVRTWLIRPN